MELFRRKYLEREVKELRRAFHIYGPYGIFSASGKTESEKCVEGLMGSLSLILGFNTKLDLDKETLADIRAVLKKQLDWMEEVGRESASVEENSQDVRVK